MIETLTPILIAFFGLLSSIVVYFQLDKRREIKKLDNAKELEELKLTNQNLLIDKIDASLKELRVDLETFKKEIAGSIQALKNAEQRLSETQAKAQAVFQSLQDFIQSTDRRFKLVEKVQQAYASEVQKINEDLVFVKSKLPKG